MTPGSSQETVQKNGIARLRPSFSSFPHATMETVEQQRRFELLRLAFFVLKLRKVEQCLSEESGDVGAPDQQLDFRGNLLRHAIFHQVLTLIRLDAREEAMQIITACRKS